MNSFEVFNNAIGVASELDLIATIGREIKNKLPIASNGRSHILRFGWDYLGDKNLGERPVWVPDMVPEANSWTVNRYPEGHAIAPHIDSLKFDDEISILSLGVATEMQFFSPYGLSLKFKMLPRSLAKMSGELRRTWKHGTLPTNEGTRFSIVYRRKL